MVRVIDDTYLPPLKGEVEPQDRPVVDNAPDAVMVIGGIIVAVLAGLLAWGLP